MTGHVRPGDNPDLTVERRNASFDVERLSKFLHGEERLRTRRRIAEFVEKHPELHDPEPIAFMSREQRYENASRKIVRMLENLDVIDASDPTDVFYFQRYNATCLTGLCLFSLVMGNDGHPLNLHFVMFLPTLLGQMNDEQQAEWVQPAMNRHFIGTYAQTELGHGTNLKALETTATYDKTRQEFELHSPTLTSLKWWPGNLGKTANYAIVGAHLIIDGQNYGAHLFMVQLRDLETHQPLPGITVGDIGPKFSINTNDNGFLRLDHVRIARNAMLMRHAKVTPDGQYIKPSHDKLGYGSMVFVRSTMIKYIAENLAAATTIAIRYSCVRRQGEITPGAGEVKLLEYQTQQYRLFPQLARAYAFIFAGIQMRTVFERVSAQLSSGETGELAELHALSSGVKATVSFQVSIGIEQCRMSCGGHGYMSASNLPELYGVAVGGCTYEGDNLVLYLQVARSLIKAARAVKSGAAGQLAQLTRYLADLNTQHSRLGYSPSAFESNAIAAMEHAARRAVFSVLEQLDQLQTSGLAPEHAWNQCSVELCKAARAHVRIFLVKTFFDAVKQVEDNATKTVLGHLAKLYALYELMDSAPALLQDSYVNGEQMAKLKLWLRDCLKEIRPDAIALVDAFDFTDRQLNSVLGRRDGHVYPHLLKWAESSNLNRDQVMPAFHKYLGPMMKDARRTSSKL